MEDMENVALSNDEVGVPGAPVPEDPPGDGSVAPTPPPAPEDPGPPVEEPVEPNPPGEAP